MWKPYCFKYSRISNKLAFLNCLKDLYVIRTDLEKQRYQRTPALVHWGIRMALPNRSAKSVGVADSSLAGLVP